MLDRSRYLTSAVCVTALCTLVSFTACTDSNLTDPNPDSIQAAKGGGGGKGGGGKGGGGKAPRVDATDPSEAQQDTRLYVRVLGSGFDKGSEIQMTLGGDPTGKVRTNSTRFVSQKELVADITIAFDAVEALYDVEVMTGRGKKGIGSELFRVRKRGDDAYTITDLGTLPGGGGGVARDISDANSAVGTAEVEEGGVVATLWTWQVTQTGEINVDPPESLGVPEGYHSSYGNAINSFGTVVVGSASPDGFASKPVRWTLPNGSPAVLGTLPSLPDGGASDVNNNSLIVGGIAYITPEEKIRRAVVWYPDADPPTPTELPTLPGFIAGDWSGASGINNAGHVVGHSNVQLGGQQFFHAVLWLPADTESGYMACNLHPAGAYSSMADAVSEPAPQGEVRVLGTRHIAPGEGSVVVWTLNLATGGCPEVVFEDLGLSTPRYHFHDINTGGELAGQDIQGTSNPFHWTPAAGLVELPTLQGQHGAAEGINNAGRIVGSSIADGGETHAVLWIKN